MVGSIWLADGNGYLTPFSGSQYTYYLRAFLYLVKRSKRRRPNPQQEKNVFSQWNCMKVPFAKVASLRFCAFWPKHTIAQKLNFLYLLFTAILYITISKCNSCFWFRRFWFWFHSKNRFRGSQTTKRCISVSFWSYAGRFQLWVCNPLRYRLHPIGWVGFILKIDFQDNGLIW